MTESWEIGMMHPAYQTGRTVLVDWINDNFDVKYKKVEDCATGAIYCQMLDAIYPTSARINLKTVKWGKKLTDNEKLGNWKKVQNVLTKKGITKPIDVDKLIKAKLQDNIEFLQWFAHFFNCTYGGQAYDAKLRRGNKKTPSNCQTVLNLLVVKDASSKSTSKSTSKTAVKRAVKAAKSNKKIVMVKTQLNKKKKQQEKNEVKSSEEKQKLTQTLEAVEKERNFYFSKLREIEILCQETQEENVDKLKDSVKKILYKTDEDGDMVVPDEGDDDDDKQDDGEEVSIDPDADETTF